MTVTQTNCVLMVSVGEALSPDLRVIASRLRLTVIEAWSVESAFESIMRLRPAAVVITVEPLRPDLLKLIRLITHSHRAVPVVAVTLSPSEQLERAAVQAGAQYYLTEPTTTRGAETISAILLALRQRQACVEM